MLKPPASWQALAARGDMPGGRPSVPERGQKGTSPSGASLGSKDALVRRVYTERGTETRRGETSALASLLQRGEMWDAARDLPSIAARLRQHESAASGAPLVVGAGADVPSLLRQIQHSQGHDYSSLLTWSATEGTPLVYSGLPLQGSGSDASEGLLTTSLHIPQTPASDASRGPAPGASNALRSQLSGVSESRLESLVTGAAFAGFASSASQGLPLGLSRSRDALGLAEIVKSLASDTPSGSQLDLLMAQLRILHQLQTQGSSSLPAAGLAQPPAPASAIPSVPAPLPSPAPAPASAIPSVPAPLPAPAPASIVSLGAVSLAPPAPAPAPTLGLTPAVLAGARSQLLSRVKQEAQDNDQAGSLRVHHGREGFAELRFGSDQRLELNEHPAEQGTLGTRLTDSQLETSDRQHHARQLAGDQQCGAEVKQQGSASPRESDSQGRGKRGRAKNEEVSGDTGDGEEAGLGREQKKLRLSREEQEMLDLTFQRQPRPSQREKEGIARELHATIRQVEVWFQNRRARSKIKESAKELEALKLKCEALERQNKKLRADLAKALDGQACRNCMHIGDP